MTVATGWHPIAASDDVPPGHVYQTRLRDLPLAVWRAGDGRVNVWEDRCPHRGVRFSIGTALGHELRCQYHAWRFASGSGACTFIPAHPDRKPAAAIRATTLPAAERAGLIWTWSGGGKSEPPAVDAAGPVVRALPVNRPAAMVEAAIAAAPPPGVRLFVQPVAAGRAVIRGVADDGRPLVEHDAALERLRRMLEAG